MLVGGLDLSITSPAITLFDSALELYDHYCYVKDEKLVSAGNFSVTIQPLWKTQEERFDNLSNWCIDILRNCDFVGLEGYAFGARGKITNLAENTGTLKHKLYKNNIPFVIYDPKTIKKFATNNGNAGKPLMEQFWLKERGIDIRKKLGQTWRGEKLPESPAYDIIDSYFICKYTFKEFTKTSE